MKFKLGIFDHSGVLSDDRQPVYEANMHLLARCGLDKITFEEWKKASKACVADFFAGLRIKINREQVNEDYARVYTELTTRKVNPILPIIYPDARDVLRKLKEKGLKTAIVSSHPRANLNDELRRYGIFQLFDEISGDPSPKTQRLLQICQRFSVAPENTFFVEDTTYGLKSGKDAGLVCFGITTGYHTREKLEAEGNAVAVVDSLTQLLELVI